MLILPEAAANILFRSAQTSGTLHMTKGHYPQAGFGWTNGVVLWTAGNYGKVLVAPKCPSLLDVPNSSPSSQRGAGTTSRLERFAAIASILSVLITPASILLI